MSCPLTIWLHYNDLPACEVTVDSRDTVKSLESYLGDDLPHVLYLGEYQMSPVFTLGFIGVKNGDHILAVSKVPDEKCKSLKPSKEVIEAPVDRKEQVNARLQDQFFNHIEGTSVSYRRLVSRFIRSKAHADKKKNKGKKKEKTMIPVASDQPATDAFPMPW